MNLDLFAEPSMALQVWRLCLPCCFGRRAFWHLPVKAAGWVGRDHCEACCSEA